MFMLAVNKQLKTISLLESVAKRAYQNLYGPSWRLVHGEAYVLCEPREKAGQLL